jgi:hypothetical protein
LIVPPFPLVLLLHAAAQAAVMTTSEVHRLSAIV